MNYNDLLNEIRIVFLDEIERKLNSTNSVKQQKPELLETIYTNVMSLGYNNKNISMACEDIIEMRSVFSKLNNDDQKSIQDSLNSTLIDFSKLVELFVDFHKRTQNDESFENVLEIIKKKISDDKL